jgi:type IV pilus assembly protein PilV
VRPERGGRLVDGVLMKMRAHRRRQGGAVLLEALFAILLFSIGVLALVALQAVSIKNSIDAKYRTDASYLANQIVARMWTDRSNLDRYSHYATGPLCAFTGSASADASPWVTPVTDWVAEVTGLLPGSAADKTQIVVTDVGTTKQVKVTVCWKSPQETGSHNFVVTAQINPP